jgi:hypothetical protein
MPAGRTVRDPTRDRPAVALIALAETLREPRLLDRDDEEVRREEKHDREQGDRGGALDERDADVEERGAERHRVVDPAVRPRGDEDARGIERGRGAAPAHGEEPDARQRREPPAAAKTHPRGTAQAGGSGSIGSRARTARAR